MSVQPEALHQCLLLAWESSPNPFIWCIRPVGARSTDPLIHFQVTLFFALCKTTHLTFLKTLGSTSCPGLGTDFSGGLETLIYYLPTSASTQPPNSSLSISPSLSLSHTRTHVDLKKCTTWELWVKFYSGQSESCSPRDIIPGSSEKLLQRSREEGHYTCDFWWRGNTGNQALFFFFFAEGFCYSSEAIITMKDFSAFPDMRRYKSWAHKIGSWKDLTILRPVLPVFPRAQSTSFVLSHLNSFQGVLKVSSCSNVC